MSCPGRNDLGAIAWGGKIAGGNCPGWNFMGAVVRVAVVHRGTIQGQLFGGENFQRRNVLGGFHGGQLSREGIVIEPNFL